LPNRLMGRLPGPRRGECFTGWFRRIKRATLRRVSARRPLARDSVTKRATLGCVGGLGDLAMLPAATLPKGLSTPSALLNYAGPQHLCHYRGCDSAWVPGTVLGSPVREIDPSLPDRSWPHRASVTHLYYVTPVTARGNCRENTDGLWTGVADDLLER